MGYTLEAAEGDWWDIGEVASAASCEGAGEGTVESSGSGIGEADVTGGSGRRGGNILGGDGMCFF